MATDSVDFYARMQKLEETQQNREKQRTKLEQEFNVYIKSDTRLNKVRASKLQSYWTKICEDERRSKARNDQLLREYERVDAHVAALSARTDRLKLLKDQYEKQIEIMYPRWQEQVEIKRRQQLLQQQKEQQQLAQRVQQLHQLQSTGQQQQQQQHLPLNQQQQFGQQHQQLSHQHGTPVLQQQQQQQFLPQQQQLQHQPLNQQQQFGQRERQLPHQQGTQVLQQHSQFAPQHHMEQVPYSNHQQQQQQQPPGQITDASGEYDRLKRASPGIPNIQVQANTPPQSRLQDPLYASLQFGSLPQNLSYDGSTSGPGFQTNLQEAADYYETPSGTSRFSTRQNGSLGYSQQGQGSVMYGESGPVLDNRQLQYQDGDGGYTKLNARIQSTRLPSADSSIYTDIQHDGAGGGRPTFETFPQAGVQAPSNHPKAPQHTQPTKAVSNTSMDAASTYPPSQASSINPLAPSSQPPVTTQPARLPRGKSSPNLNQAKKTVLPQINDSDGDNDSVVTPLNDDDLYETPTTTHSRGGSSQLKPTELLKPSERAGSAVSGKAISTARTDPFSSEEDEDEEDSLAEEDTAALRNALQRQLHVGGDETSERKQNFAADADERAGDQPSKAARGKSDSEKAAQQEPAKPRQMQESKVQSQLDERDSASDSDDEIGSDMSLPLSDEDETGPRSGSNKMAAGKTPASNKMSQEARSKPKASTLMVTEQGFWRLVSAVEQEIDQSDNIEKIYNQPESTQAIKTEIAKTVNNNGSLDHLDPNAISMVVLQQLQQIVLTFPGGCLLSDKLLDTNRTITEVTVRSFLRSSALGFWDNLLQHLVLLIRKGVMDAEDVANMVAPLLISDDSTMADKAVDVLITILQEQEQLEDSQLDDTYSTLPSASATPAHLSMPQEGATNQSQVPPIVPRLDLGGTGDHKTPEIETDRVSHDSFFDEPAVPLTETKAYQQMMQSSQGSAKLKDLDGLGDSEEGDEEDSSEDDEIEKATRLSPETPPSSRNKRRRNVLSSFGGSNSLGLSYGDDDDEDGNEAKQDGGETKRSEQMSDLISSPSPSPSPKGSGYVPSAMEQSMKSTGRSDPLQRSAAFWGEESDMEESEMSVPMGTLKSDDLKDDFDFYD
ncbi:uncharacterized protein [Asterias amurensis]|uniref:uncharacterized protein isoform X2 n=1 Tax=Asterias amurensis TaxID=7602 RepID=UPI003AB18E44